MILGRLQAQRPNGLGLQEPLDPEVLPKEVLDHMPAR